MLVKGDFQFVLYTRIAIAFRALIPPLTVRVPEDEDGFEREERERGLSKSGRGLIEAQAKEIFIVTRSNWPTERLRGFGKQGMIMSS